MKCISGIFSHKRANKHKARVSFIGLHDLDVDLKNSSTSIHCAASSEAVLPVKMSVRQGSRGAAGKTTDRFHWIINLRGSHPQMTSLNIIFRRTVGLFFGQNIALASFLNKIVELG